MNTTPAGGDALTRARDQFISQWGAMDRVSKSEESMVMPVLLKMLTKSRKQEL